MLALQNEPNLPGAPVRKFIPPLENGDLLHSCEFLRRYDRMPELKKAELVNGQVFMGHHVLASLHGAPHGMVSMLLGYFSAYTPGTTSYSRPTLVVDEGNVFQPDCVLCINNSGRTWANEDDLLCGAPELVFEVSVGSTSLDVLAKKQVCERLGVLDYVVWCTLDARLHWFHREGERFVETKPNTAGLLCSRSLPGLQTPVADLLALNGLKVMTCLEEGLATPAHAEFVRSLAAA